MAKKYFWEAGCTPTSMWSLGAKHTDELASEFTVETLPTMDLSWIEHMSSTLVSFVDNDNSHFHTTTSYVVVVEGSLPTLDLGWLHQIYGRRRVRAREIEREEVEVGAHSETMEQVIEVGWCGRDSWGGGMLGVGQLVRIVMGIMVLGVQGTVESFSPLMVWIMN